MFTVKNHRSFEQLKQILRESDGRVTAFFEELMEQIAEMYMQQVLRRIPRDDEYKEYRESFRAWVSEEMNKLEPESLEKKTEIRKVENYWSGVEAVGNIKGFNELWLERTLVKVKKERNVELPFKDLMLFRYQPWTLDTIPFLPVGENAYFVYETIGLNEFYKVRIGARNKKAMVRGKIKARGMSYENDKQIMAKFKAISNLFDIALRLEKGIMTQKKSHWIPASEYVAKIGMKTLLKNQRILHDTIFRVGYKGWKRKKPRLDDIPMNRVESMKEFVERIV